MCVCVCFLLFHEMVLISYDETQVDAGVRGAPSAPAGP